MIVVGIIGVLAAIAIPAFTRYIRKSRTAEAAAQLNKMWAGSITYFMSDFSAIGGGEGLALPRQFPEGNGGWEQASGQCCRLPSGHCPGGSTLWATDDVWLALKFALADDHNYVPGYTGAATGSLAKFTAMAIGDLDCDDTLATFKRDGYVTPGGDVAGQTSPIVVNELE
jgi:type II secretory pathway pseudopilin PulG